MMDMIRIMKTCSTVSVDVVIINGNNGRHDNDGENSLGMTCYGCCRRCAQGNNTSTHGNTDKRIMMSMQWGGLSRLGLCHFSEPLCGHKMQHPKVHG